MSDDNVAVLAIGELHNPAAINCGPLAMRLFFGKYRPGTQSTSSDIRGVNSPQWMKYIAGGKPSSEWLGKIEALRETLASDGRTLSKPKNM